MARVVAWEKQEVMKVVNLSFVEKGNRTFVLNCKGTRLGIIELDPVWKCVIWEQDPKIKMSYKCLEQINEKIKEISFKAGVALK